MPRPRTQSGSATWADTNSVVIMIVHEAPARRLAASARPRPFAAPYIASAAIVPSVARTASRSGPSRSFSQLRPSEPTIEPRPIKPIRAP